MRKYLSILSFFAFLFFYNNAHAISQYRVVDLGTLGGAGSSASSINNLGQITGTSTTGYYGGVEKAFIWDPNEGMRPISMDRGSEINDNGVIIGTTRTSQGNVATSWSNSIVSFIPTIPNISWTLGFGVNDSNQATGWAFTTQNTYNTFMWSIDSGAIDIINNGGGSDINNNQYITGNEEGHGYIWSETSGLQRLEMRSNAFAINNNNEFVGFAISPNLSHTAIKVFGYSNDAITLGSLLGHTDSEARGINDLGQVVGRSGTNIWDIQRAFLYTDSEIQDINSLIVGESEFSVLLDAWDINNAGQIVGQGLTKDGKLHAFVATPVPLPSSIYLFGSVIFGLAWYSKWNLGQKFHKTKA